MIYISSSTLSIAKPIIEFLNLKKEHEHTKFQIFSNENFKFIITEKGQIDAIVGVTYLFSKNDIKSDDIYINIGIAKSFYEKNGEFFLCNKIIDNWSKNSFYPDILFKHPFRETSLETFYNLENILKGEIIGKIFDTESYGIYKALSFFIKNHQQFYLKIVYNNLNEENNIKEIILKNLSVIFEWAKSIENVLKKLNFSLKGEEEIINKIIKNLKLTTFMENEFKQLILYYKSEGKDIEKLLKEFENIVCNSKKEGKEYFEKLRNRILQQ